MQRKLDPKPEVLRIEELVQKVKSGDIKLPKFQRPFVWKKKDILKLLDSIYQGYPIGSILLWLTKQHLASENKIGDLEINERPEEYPTNYLLDGQQRISSLCGAIYWNGKNEKSIWNIVFDVKNEVFLYPNGDDKIEYFPLNKLIETIDFLDQCKRFEASGENRELYIQNATNLLNSIKDYKIASVTIGDMELDEVAPIFERINSTGRQLTMVDLMRAATWSGGFDLSNAIDEVRKSCEDKNFEDIQDSHILRNISACSGLGVHKESIDKLRDKSSEELKDAAEKTRLAYEKAVDFLVSELPLKSIKNLPYGLQLTFLVEFFNRTSSLDPNKIEILKKWFWKSSFTKYFGSANTGLITRSLTEVRDFAHDKVSNLNISGNINYASFVSDTFLLNKASSTTFSLLLAQENPRSLLEGMTIDLYRSLANVNRLEFHHIFPKAYLKSQGYSSQKINAHANLCMLNLSSNRAILDSKPSIYFKEMERKLGDSFKAVLASNFINEAALDAALNDDYEQFIKARSDSLIIRMKDLVGEQ